MKIALVHEFLNQLGGAERVLQNFLEIWPEAEVHVILYDKNKTNGDFEKYHKKVSWLNDLPGIKNHPRIFLAFMPKAIESFRFDDYDVVLSDSSSFAKGALVQNKLHICYMHTPTRFLWSMPGYIDDQQYPQILKTLGKQYLKRLKKWDYDAAQRPNFIIANSKNIQNQVQKYYNRESIVIPPPVDTEFFKSNSERKDYFFTASRLEPYKNIDLVIEAFNELGLKLKVAGSGTHAENLKKLAKANIEFLGRVSDEQLRTLYSEAKAFIFPAEEDAGIMPVESMACGTPVIAYGVGGSLESIIEGQTGEFFYEQTKESLIEKLKKFDPSKYNSQKIREHAQQFDKKIFQKKIKEFVESKYENRT
jgi:glycosyltransferase involved in cell wall biosynthesis